MEDKENIDRLLGIQKCNRLNIRDLNEKQCIEMTLKTIQKVKPNDVSRQEGVGKCNERASDYRLKGNELFTKKQWLSTLKEYTKSIAFAETDTEMLGLAYGNRSALLFERGFYQQCLEDIDRALHTNLSDDKKQKLVARQQKAKKLALTQKKQILNESIPTVANKNPTIQSASDAVIINKNEKFGRFIEASRDIKPGEILLVEKPYVLTISQAHDYKYLHCSECAKLCFNLIPCKNCTSELYCSQICLIKAHNEYHKYECVILKYYLQNIEDSETTMHIALRATLKGLTESKDETDEDVTYHSDCYKEIDQLVYHKKEIPLIIFGFSADLANIFYILKTETDVLSKFAHIDDNREKETELQSLLVLNALRCICNEVEMLYWHWKGVQHGDLQDVTKINIGSCLYSCFSLFNHSCVWNVGVSFYGSIIVARVLREIKKGEQCFINYGCPYFDKPKDLRQKILKTRFSFTCICKACAENWPIDGEGQLSMNGVNAKNFNVSTSLSMKMLSEEILFRSHLDEEERQGILNKCYQMITNAEHEEPSHFYVQMYKLFGILLPLRYRTIDL